MANVCPNTKSPEWKALVNRFGETIAWALYTKGGDTIPPLRTALQMVEKMNITYEQISVDERVTLGVSYKDGSPRTFKDYNTALSKAISINTTKPELRASVSNSVKTTGKSTSVEVHVTRYKLNDPEIKPLQYTAETPKVLEEYQLSNIEDRTPDAALNKVLRKWMNKLGISYNPTDVIYDSEGNVINAIAKADMFTKIVSVVEGKADISTLSEECAHMLVHMMKDNPLVERLRKAAKNSSMYAQVVSEYSDAYNNNEEKLLEETVGKLIAQEVIRIWDETSNEYTSESKATQSTVTTLFNRLLTYFKTLLSKVNFTSESISEDMAPFSEAALMLLNTQTTGLSSLSNATKNEFYYELDIRMTANQQEVLSYLNTIPIQYDPISHIYKKADGTVVKRRVSDLVKEAKKRIFNIWGETSSINMAYSIKGTTIHKWNEVLMRDLLEGKEGTYIQNINKVLADLRSLPEFEEYSPKQLTEIVSLDETQFEALKQGVKAVYDGILKNQAYINLSTKTVGTPTIILEQAIYDEDRDIAGTCDLLVVYSNGTIGIYDYKGISMKTFKNKVLYGVTSKSREAFDVQLTQYKNILTAGLRKEALKNNKDLSLSFAESRVIPINMQLNKEVNTGEPSVYGFKSLEMMETGKEYLSPLPSSNEESHNPAITKSIEALLNIRSAQRKLAKDVPSKENKLKLARTEKLIDSILVNQDFNYAIDEIFEIQTIFNKRKTIPIGTEGSLTNEDLKELNDRRSSLQGFFEDITEVVEELNDPEFINRLNQALGISGRLKLGLSQAIQDLLHYDTKVDISKPGAKLGFGKRWFSKLSDQNHPIFQALSKLIKGAQDKIYNKWKDTVETVNEKHAELAEWAKQNNMTLQETFDRFIDKKKGTLINKISDIFYEDLVKARTEGSHNTNFMLKHFELARGKGKILFTYTGSALKQFTIESKRWEAALEKVKGTHDEEHMETLYTKWRHTNDVSFNKDAIFNSKNKFLTTRYVKDESLNSYFTEEYKYIAAHPVLDAYYKMYLEFNKEFSAVTGRDINSRFIPNIRKDLIDALFEDGIGALGKLKGLFLGALETRDESDIIYKSQEDATQIDHEGKPLKHIPILYLDPLRGALSKKEIQQAENNIDKDIPKDSEDWKRARDKNIREIQLKKGVTEKSYDLSKTLIMMAKSVYTYEHMKTIEAATQNLLATANSNKVRTSVEDKSPYMNKVRDKTLSYFGIHSDDISTLEKYIDLYVYQKSLQNGTATFNIGEREYSWGSVLKTNIQWAAASTLGLKPTLGIRNYVQNMLGFYLQSAEGKYYSSASTKQSEVLKKEDPIKYQALMDYFHITNKDIWKEAATKLSTNKVNKIINMENLFILLELTDTLMDKKVLSAMSFEWGWDEDLQKVVRLSKHHEAIKIIDLLNINPTTGEYSLSKVSEAETIRFRTMAQQAATSVKGIMPKEDSYLAGTTVAGSIVMLYRNWMPGLIQTRWKSFDFDPVLEEYDVGRFLVGYSELSKGGLEIGKAFSRMLVRSIPIIGTLAGKNLGQNEVAARKQYDQYFSQHPEVSKLEFTFEEFLTLRLNKLKALAYEFQSIVALFLAALAAKGLVPEGEDKKDNYLATLATQNLYRSLYGCYLEASFFVSFSSVTDIVSSPTALIGHVRNVMGFFTNFIDETNDIITGDVGKGNFFWSEDPRDKKGKFFYTTKLIPGVNAAQDFFNLYDTFTFNMR